MCSFIFPQGGTSFLIPSSSHSRGVIGIGTLPQSTIAKVLDSDNFQSSGQLQSYHHCNKKASGLNDLRKSNTELRDCTKSNLFSSPHSNNRRLQHNSQVIAQEKKESVSKYVRRSLPLLQIYRPLGAFITRILKFIIVSVTFFIMKILNKTYLHDPNNNLQKYCFDRKQDVGLLTISNHCSIMDDPGIWVGTLPMRKLTLNNMRHTLMMEESYYQFGRLGAFILHGLNCLPIKRDNIGRLQSPQMYELQKRLNGISSKKEWCHIMVEGSINQPWRFKLPHGNSLPQLGNFQLDAAKLIATSPPSKTVVLPVYHYGMHNIFTETPPDGSSKATQQLGKTNRQLPGWQNHIDVYVGDPIDFRDIVSKEGLPFEKSDYNDLLSEINTRLCDAMLKLEFLASQQRT